MTYDAVGEFQSLPNIFCATFPYMRNVGWTLMPPCHHYDYVAVIMTSTFYSFNTRSSSIRVIFKNGTVIFR